MIRIYYRVSTNEQDFNMQKHAMESYLKLHNIDIEHCKIYEDFGVSGTTAKRESYQRLMSEVQESDTIYVYELSRLWRDLEEQIRASKIFKVLNVNVIALDGNGIRYDSTNLLATIMGAVHSDEAERTRHRSKEGIKAKQAKVEAGLDVWKKRGKDKDTRKKDGYFKRWQNYREQKQLSD